MDKKTAEDILTHINSETKLGDLRKIAKEIKQDHELAMELWSTEEFLPRLLAILIMDKKLLTQDVLNGLDKDMQTHPFGERNNLMDWLMANQLTKSKKTIALIESWENSSSALQRRTFWYYQARLRWTGQIPPENTEELLSALEASIMQEEPEVKWAMNFTAGWIGVYDEKNRARCMQLGEKTGLYKDQVVAKGCTPDYLPSFITIEVNKRK
ncbi:DNA alkylation repair protein [Listeria booriae]|uniref:DNA alkylation repair protein n=1 Tax=Listeria booriae TaxID=1552123 RepID=UPI001625C9D9|nr:DNA alkylation repair protein [Listeria booriae]MBC1225903.1 DNA alkylation repair protein [Listeria booriae]MBC1232594.1 DNA alkylation repair protein [Listeria booriae]MBC1246420.1 DNA alkylation repair protein [Listeria booriae]